jgi:hypothetical protein
MTEWFNLDFHGTKFPVPKASLCNLFEHQHDLIDATSYGVQSSVPLDLFELFARSLEACEKVPVTKDNAGALSLLAKGFWFEDLLSECSALQMASTPELIAALSQRISKLEHHISSHALDILAELKESMENHDRQLESLDCRISALEPNLTTDLSTLKSSSPAPVSPSKSPTEVKCPFKKGLFSMGDPLDGIISYLTRKHGGNVHDKGIVTITSKSVDFHGRNRFSWLADLTSDYCFHSEDAPGQWVCWDFHELRVRPTHYTIKSVLLRSWVVEGSLDGKAWTVIDRKTDNNDFSADQGTASFAVSKSVECRFIRLTQTGKDHRGDDILVIWAFEFFGTLLE